MRQIAWDAFHKHEPPCSSRLLKLPPLLVGSLSSTLSRSWDAWLWVWAFQSFISNTYSFCGSAVTGWLWVTDNCESNSIDVYKYKQIGKKEADTYPGLLVKVVNFTEFRITQDRPLTLPGWYHLGCFRQSGETPHWEWKHSLRGILDNRSGE